MNDGVCRCIERLYWQRPFGLGIACVHCRAACARPIPAALGFQMTRVAVRASVVKRISIRRGPVRRSFGPDGHFKFPHLFRRSIPEFSVWAGNVAAGGSDPGGSSAPRDPGLQLLSVLNVAARRHTRSHPRLQAQMREFAPSPAPPANGGDEFMLASVVRTVFGVDQEYAPMRPGLGRDAVLRSFASVSLWPLWIAIHNGHKRVLANGSFVAVRFVAHARPGLVRYGELVGVLAIDLFVTSLDLARAHRQAHCSHL